MGACILGSFGLLFGGQLGWLRCIFVSILLLPPPLRSGCGVGHEVDIVGCLLNQEDSKTGTATATCGPACTLYEVREGGRKFPLHNTVDIWYVHPLKM